MKTRLLQNSSARALLGAGAHVPLPPVPIADFAAGACEIAAREVASWMVLGGRSRLVGALLSVDVLSWQIRLHRLVPHPRCSICGSRAPRPAEPPALGARGYERSRGWHRIASPRETLARHEHHVSPLLGVVRTLERDPQHEEIHVYHASVNLPPGTSLPQARRVVAGGKGTSAACARASALCEALERYSSFAHGDEAILRGRSRREMGEAALDVEATLLFSRRQFEERARWNARGGPWSRVPEPFREDEPLDWCALWSLSRGEVRYAPTALCLGGHLPGRAMLPWDSSGCASGNCLEEAALHGLLELIERDGTAIWWYNRLPRAGVDLASFADPWLASVEQWLSEEGRRLWALDLSFDLGIPSFGAFSDHQGGPVVFGFGAHTSPRLALRRAVSEMLQFLVVEEVALRRAPGTPEQAAMRRWLEEVRCADEPWLRPCPGLPEVKGGSMIDLSTGDLLGDFSLCRRRVEAAGCEVFWMDLTRPDVRLPTVRVVVPGLRSVRRRLAPGRLYDVPVGAGLLPEALDETLVNPLDFILLPPRTRGARPSWIRSTSRTFTGTWGPSGGRWRRPGSTPPCAASCSGGMWHRTGSGSGSSTWIFRCATRPGTTRRSPESYDGVCENTGLIAPRISTGSPRCSTRSRRPRRSYPASTTRRSGRSWKNLPPSSTSASGSWSSSRESCFRSWESYAKGASRAW